VRCSVSSVPSEFLFEFSDMELFISPSTGIFLFAPNVKKREILSDAFRVTLFLVVEVVVDLSSLDGGGGCLEYVRPLRESANSPF